MIPAEIISHANTVRRLASEVDGSFSTNGKIVIEEIFHMLKRTHHCIVCEGVETKEVADFLTVAGCNEMQGFYYYKPMPSESFSELLDSMQ